MDYEIGHAYLFETNRDFDDDSTIRVKVPGFPDASLIKLKFQREEPTPSTIFCRVKAINKQGIFLGHHMPQYVARFYMDGYRNGEDFEFTVIGLPSGAGEPYILEDSYGLRFNLMESKVTLSLGRKVNCRFTLLNKNRFNIVLSDSTLKIPYISPESFLERIGAGRYTRQAALRMLASLDEMRQARAEINAENPSWILTVLDVVSTSLNDYFRHIDNPQRMKRLEVLLQCTRSAALYIIEGSNFLRNASVSQRNSIRAKMTSLVESLKPYTDALQLFADNGVDSFITSLMEKLRTAGYLYHPVSQFATLMMIFRASPALVKSYLGGIFDTIMEWNLSTWTAEPFRSAFVGQFEIYIQLTGQEISRMPQAQDEAVADRLEKAVTAIALQMLIAGDTDPDLIRRSRSLLYRYIALLRPTKSDVLLQKSFLTLLGVDLPVEFTYDDIKASQMLMTKASIDPGRYVADLKSQRRVLRMGDIQLSISTDGIVMSNAHSQSATPVIPHNMMPLFSPQIYADDVKSLAGSRLDNLDAHRRLWADIEASLFRKSATPQVPARKPRRAETGDTVMIIIDPRETAGGDNPMWKCVIDDPLYQPGQGYIERSDIVTFSLRGIDIDRNRYLFEKAMRTPEGVPAHFLAVVENVDNVGNYHFSLQSDVTDQIPNILTYENISHGVVTWMNDREYLVLSDTGYGVYLDRDDDSYRAGDIVDFRVVDHSVPTHLKGILIGLADNDVYVDKASAFCNLLANIAIEVDPELEAETDDYSSDDVIAVDDALDIIELLRFKAFNSAKLITAFDYLMYARLLARAVGDDTLAEHLLTHANLLHMHQFYAANSRIDAAELMEYSARVESSPVLQIIFHRLEIVSWMGDESRNDMLWHTISTPRNDLENTLARLVLSYNMLPADTRQSSDLAKGLKNEIARMLGVNTELPTLKSYGSENQFVEFKSSIVYPARRNAFDKNEPDPERQQFVILRTIAGFLNASGGTLYIGVNDITHCEAGLFEDFEYFRRHKGVIGGNYFDIANIDNMCNFIANLVRHTWGTIVAESVEIEPDSEAERDVIVVKIQPRVVPVVLDGDIYVRRSGATMRVDEKDHADFIQERKDRELQRRAAAMAVTEAYVAPTTTVAVEQKPQAESHEPEPEYGNTDVIATSAWRPNALHTTDEGYFNPAGYLYFEKDNMLSHSRRDYYREYELPLVLAMSEAETRDGMLLMVFEHGRVLKVPMTEILEKPGNVPMVYARGYNLKWASIASPSDALALYLADSKGNLYRRVVPVSSLTAAHLTSTPENITGQEPELVTCETVAGRNIDNFTNSLPANMSSRQLGFTMRCHAHSDKASQYISEDVKAAEYATNN